MRLDDPACQREPQPDAAGGSRVAPVGAEELSVLERTREIGMMKAVGAGDRRVFRLVVGEAVTVGVASWLVAVAVVVPATYFLDRFMSAQGFVTATFVISPLAIAGWLAVAVAGSAIASFLPARRAARLTVREALAET